MTPQHRFMPPEQINESNFKSVQRRSDPLDDSGLREYREFSKHQPVADSIAATLFR